MCNLIRIAVAGIPFLPTKVRRILCLTGTGKQRGQHRMQVSSAAAAVHWVSYESKSTMRLSLAGSP